MVSMGGSMTWTVCLKRMGASIFACYYGHSMALWVVRMGSGIANGYWLFLDGLRRMAQGQITLIDINVTKTKPHLTPLLRLMTTPLAK